MAELHRTIAVKVEIDWKNPESKQLYQRLRDLSWQAAHYRNGFVRRLWAEAMGWRVAPEEQDKHDITREHRASGKGQLSGDAYSSAESEVRGSWSRDRKKILAGQPLPEWKTSSALSVTGRKDKKGSGVRLEVEDGQYVCYLRAQSQDSPGGCWLRLPIAKNTRRDEYQAAILTPMVSWEIPIAKATVKIKQHGAVVRLSYEKQRAPLPGMGDRIATLGPLEQSGRLLLRTELQTKDYTAEFGNLMRRKDAWDQIRRRVVAQIGRRRGHARAKRQRLERMSWDDWLHTHLHTWSRNVVDWCGTQGVGTIHVECITSGDWPAWKFMELLRYKADEAGIAVVDFADVTQAGAARAVKSVIRKSGEKVRKRHEALRELAHQLTAPGQRVE